MGNIIFTNKALTKMKDLGLSESYVLDAFNSGAIEKWSVGGEITALKNIMDMK